jgi:hypothetical protein
MSRLDVNSELLGRRGTKLVNDTTAVEERFVGMLLSEGTIIDELEVDGVDVLSEYITTPSTATEMQTLIKLKHTSNYFTKIKLTEGQALIILI